MPFDERFWFHDQQRVAPGEEFRQRNHREAIGGCCPAWPCLALLEQDQLFSEEKILGHEGRAGGKEQPDARQQLRILQELGCFSAVRTEFLRTTGPPQLDAATAMDYRRQADKLFLGGGQAERKQLLRMLVGEVKLMPQDLEVSITYRLPEAIMNGLVAGEGFEPSTFGL
jgi:hypothetical protein